MQILVTEAQLRLVGFCNFGFGNIIDYQIYAIISVSPFRYQPCKLLEEYSRGND